MAPVRQTLNDYKLVNEVDLQSMTDSKFSGPAGSFHSWHLEATGSFQLFCNLVLRF
jgi:hypothetical protein